MVDFSIALWWFTLLILVEKQIHPKVGGGGGGQNQKKKHLLFVWIPKSLKFPWISKKQKPDLLDLQDSGTSHHQDDMKQSKTWWWKQIPRDCSNPPIRVFVLFDSFRMAGTPKFGWRFSDGFWVASFFFFRRCVFGKDDFFGIIQSDQNPEIWTTIRSWTHTFFAYGATSINWWYWCFFLTWIHQHQNTKR